MERERGWFATRFHYIATQTWDFFCESVLSALAGVIFVAAGWLVFNMGGDIIIAALLVLTGYTTGFVAAPLMLILSFIQGPPDTRRYVPAR